MRIAVYGVGAVGGYYGGRLAEAGHDVTFIARGAHLAAMRRDGLQVLSPAGDFTIRPAQATDDPASVGPVDAVILGVKTWQVHDAAVAMRPMIGAGTIVVSLQNGVDSPGILADVLGKAHALAGTCSISALIEAPGRIRHASVPPSIQFGPIDPRDRAPASCEALRAAFASAKGVTAEIPADMQAALWQKFLGVAPIGAIGAITRAPMGAMRADPRTFALIEAAKREIWSVGKARGVNWAPDAIERVSKVHASVPYGTTASMQRDIIEGRPSELDSQVGAIVRLGESAGVPVPVHRFVYDCLMPQERRARGEIEF
jgi:2-dehydropantoate 2-reductase